MTATKRVRITCDTPWCHTFKDFDHQYQPAARTELAQQGWLHQNGNDYCPQHVDLGIGHHLTAVPN